MKKTALWWFAAGMLSAACLPWFVNDSAQGSLRFLSALGTEPGASLLIRATVFRDAALWPIGLCLVALAALCLSAVSGRRFALALTGVSAVSLAVLVSYGLLTDLPAGLSWGAFGLACSLLFLLTSGISSLRSANGDAFVVGLIGAVIVLVALFVFYPIAHVMIEAFELPEGGYGVSRFFSLFFAREVWHLSCLSGGGSCGPAANSLFLAVCTGLATTMLGLAFALIATRSGFRAKRLLRVLTVLPIITPPFVIGLALILLFGRAGVVTDFAHEWFGFEKTRWVYGFTGVFLAQLLSFTPIAFLVLIGVVEGVSPSMEEASQTMRASRWQTFTRVSLPLMRPGLANAFLLGFIESLADFGNPLVLGGDYGVLSTEIYFAIVGAVADSSRAAALGMVLLTMTLGAFLLQRWWLGTGSYATVTGKGDSGRHCHMSRGLKLSCYAVALPWAAFTAVVYSMILFGSIVALWGYDNSFTLAHYTRAFGFDFGDGLSLNGSAWDSYFTTLKISALAAPLTALVGLSTAYLLVRRQFAGKQVFEFGTLLSFAIPGTVVGISYILAFNVPPIELTGTGAILIIAFMFRNMPVGVRGGVAAMSQLDKSLDEASVTLGANSFTTVRRVIAPLLGPAILAALVYSFVRAITSVSAVIFLVSARHNMATSFIVGRVENGEFGIAIAYSAVLIITMLVCIGLLQLIVGRRALYRADRTRKNPLSPQSVTP